MQSSKYLFVDDDLYFDLLFSLLKTLIRLRKWNQNIHSALMTLFLE
jgi:hypothetical protein